MIGTLLLPLSGSRLPGAHRNATALRCRTEAERGKPGRSGPRDPHGTFQAIGPRGRILGRRNARRAGRVAAQHAVFVD
ncbi:hypothetical protein WS67_19190 [Burkholderia singularis]|uniref:Uncharacterized protein n=1 Tax=Burkholderia singularis TaxID=1503053 RepID=A0A103DZ64_9BURK|nr:hypothetical protein WS67_19190 [Burkholderia singularis]